jgi:Tfp pilus assembly protein FimT
MSRDVSSAPSRTAAKGRGHAGISLAELLVVLAVLGLLTAMSIPFFLGYLNNATLKTGAEEVATFLNQGRALAIKENTSICVHIATTQMHYHLSNCSGTTWIGPGTDASGNIKVPAGVTLSTTADPVFNYLGAAAPAATYTITNPSDGRTLHVTVAASGRVTIGP